MSEQKRPRGMGHGPGHGPGGMMPGEKAKNFKGTALKLLQYMGRYKIGVFAVLVFAVLSTVFGITGPKILGNATTELFKGLVAKVSGAGEIDFGRIGEILIFLLAIYLFSAFCSFIQSFVMTGITQKVCLDRKSVV